MKLSDALTQFEARLSKTEGGIVTMTPDDLVKYLGEQLALADSEGEAGKVRRDAAKAVIEAAKAAEATGATSFEVKTFVAPVAANKGEEKDPILDTLKSLTDTVKGLKDGLEKAATPALVTPPAELNKGGEQTTEGETPADPEPVSKSAPKVTWPLDLNSK